MHRHRYHGVLAPNSPLRAQVTVLAPETTEEKTRTTDADETDGSDSRSHSPARYLWATQITRLFEIFPLTRRYCGAEMKIIAFVTEPPSVRAILEHIGEPTRPSAIAPARPCAAQSCSAWVPAQTIQVWSFAAQSQLTHPHGTTRRLRSIRATISSPNRIRKWNSISASGGSGLPRQQVQQATAQAPARPPPRRRANLLSNPTFERSPDDSRPDEPLGVLA